MKIYIWLALILLSCGKSEKNINDNTTNNKTHIDSDILISLTPKVKEIKYNLIDFSYKELRGIGSADLKHYRQWPVNNFILNQSFDTLIIKFNSIQGLADYQGEIIIKQDSIILIAKANIETAAKALVYYEFIYKVKNPDKKQFKIKTITKL